MFQVPFKLIFALQTAVVEIQGNFKNAIFGHEIWNLKKNPKSCMCTLFLPYGVEIKLLSLYGQPFSKYELIFKNFHIWVYNLECEGS